jgi:Transglycosylase SLT domain
VAANRDLPRGHHHRLRDGGPELATARRARFGDANDIHFAAGPFTAFIAEASQRFNIPENWIRAGDAHRERRRLTRRFAQGRNGLMQIMPRTYAGLRARHHLGPDAYNPRDNILAGAAYLREMFDRMVRPVSSPLTTRAQLVTTSIWQPVARCRDPDLYRDAFTHGRRSTARRPNRRLL